MQFAVLALILCAAAFAEEPSIQFANPLGPRAVQEAATILRTVGDVQKLSIDGPKNSILVSGEPAVLDLAEWIAHQLDRPAGWQPSYQERNNPAVREYRLQPGVKFPAVRAFYPADPMQARTVQEIMTILRTVLDIQKVFPYSSANMFLYRGSQAQLDAVEWVMAALDAPPGTPAPAQPWKLEAVGPFDLLSVRALPADASQIQIQELIRTLRTDVHVMKVFSRTERPMLVMALNASMMDQAEKAITAMFPKQQATK
jgi:hypothetical protein